MFRRCLTALATLFGTAVLVLAGALPAWAAQAITLTWVRHAQSEANAAGVIDTTVPGPASPGAQSPGGDQRGGDAPRRPGRAHTSNRAAA